MPVPPRSTSTPTGREPGAGIVPAGVSPALDAAVPTVRDAVSREVRQAPVKAGAATTGPRGTCWVPGPHAARTGRDGVTYRCMTVDSGRTLASTCYPAYSWRARRERARTGLGHGGRPAHIRIVRPTRPYGTGRRRSYASMPSARDRESSTPRRRGSCPRSPGSSIVGPGVHPEPRPTRVPEGA